MTRRELLALAACAAVTRGQNANDRLGAAIDLMVQGLEQLSWRAAPQDVTRAIRFLRAALDEYPSFGDAHYFRALCLKRLNQDPALQKAEMEAAQRYGSEALRDNRDPFTLAVPNLAANLGPVGQKWALVVGINRFMRTFGANGLDYADADANSFAAVLRDPAVGRFPPDRVFSLTNMGATRSAILEKLNYIARWAKPEDLVLIYVATHGSDREKDLGKVRYLITYDTDVSGMDKIFATALPMKEFCDAVSTRFVAQRTVIILDTCHSGGGDAPVSRQETDWLREGAGRYILTSCDENETAYEGEGHGLFTASLLNRIKAQKGCIRVTDLYAQVARDVAGQNPKQHPQIAKSDSAAEIVLGAPVGGVGGCAPA
jgi:hypothetical protein